MEANGVIEVSPGVFKFPKAITIGYQTFSAGFYQLSRGKYIYIGKTWKGVKKSGYR